MNVSQNPVPYKKIPIVRPCETRPSFLSAEGYQKTENQGLSHSTECENGSVDSSWETGVGRRTGWQGGRESAEIWHFFGYFGKEGSKIDLLTFEISFREAGGERFRTLKVVRGFLMMAQGGLGG